MTAPVTQCRGRDDSRRRKRKTEDRAVSTRSTPTRQTRFSPDLTARAVVAREFGGKFSAHDFTAQFKREIFPRLRRYFTDGAVRVPVSKLWRDDLYAMRETFTNGQPSYWAPRTADGHSDRCTALALAVHAASNADAPGLIVPFASRRARAVEAFHGVGVFA